MLIRNRIPVAFLLGKIKFDLLAIVIYSIIVGVLDHGSYLKKVSVPLSLSAILGGALSLMLAFRINQSYDRWWEARIAWGAIVNDSRTLVRQVINFLDVQNQDLAVSFARRQIAWCYALGESLRRLPPSEKVIPFVDVYRNHSNIPNALLLKHSQEVSAFYQDGKINSVQEIQLDSTISRLGDAMGRCERIKNTVFPGNYSMLLHFLILIFSTLLPLGFTDSSILMEVALTTLFAGTFFLIERTAIFMQDPFENLPTDTPVTALANTIETNLLQMVSCPAPDFSPPRTFYQL